MIGKHKVASGLLGLLLILLLSATSVSAQQLVGGGLSVSPNRIIFEGRDRFHQVTLLNRGNDATNYRITIVATEMDEKGDIKDIENKDQRIKESKRLIRYAPRRVKLGPGESQIIRISVRKPKGLEEAEYRSNMLIAAVPEEKPEEKKLADPNEITISVTAYFAISIPVIVRHGKLYATSGAESFTLLPPDKEKNKDVRGKVILTREGDRTTYGDSLVKYYDPSGGDPVIIGQVINTGIYPPLAKRELIIPFTIPDGVALKPGGKLELTYSDKARKGDKVTPPVVLTTEVK